MANVATLGARASFDVAGFMAGVNKMMDGLREIKTANKATTESAKKLHDAMDDFVPLTSSEKHAAAMDRLQRLMHEGRISVAGFRQEVARLNADFHKTPAFIPTTPLEKYHAAVARLKEQLKSGQISVAGFRHSVTQLNQSMAPQQVAATESVFGGMSRWLTAGAVAGTAFAVSMKAVNTAVDLARAGVGMFLQSLRFGSEVALQAEKATVGLEVMMGSARKAQSFMRDIELFAVVTPFETSELVQTVQQLKAYGIATADLLPISRTLGDMSLGNAENFNRLAYAYGQVKAAGKLMASELRQVTGTGLNIMPALAKEAGVSVGQLRAEIEAGRVSFEMFHNAIVAVREAEFANGMDRASKAVFGQLSTLRDTYALTMKEIAIEVGTAIDFESLIASAVGFLSVIKEWKYEIAGAFSVLRSMANAMGDMALIVAKMPEALLRGGPVEMAKMATETAGTTASIMEGLRQKGEADIAAKREELRRKGLDKGAERLPVEQTTSPIADAIKGGIGDTLRNLIGTGANLGQSLMVKGLKGTAFLQEAAGSLFNETPRQDMERKTGALEVGSASAYSEIIRHMFGGRNKESIDSKQLAEMKRTADGIAKLSQDLLTKGFKAFGVVNNLAGAGA